MLSPEQIKQIKEQLIQQIEKSLSGKDLESAKEQIDSMDSEALEEFLKKNNMVNESGKEKCIFCSIVFGDISSYKIGENKDSIAVLEINPISKGHMLVIPRNHGDEISKETTVLAEKLSGIIQEKLSPKKVLMSEQSLFGHKVISLIPIYNNENLKSKRYKAEKEELESMQKILSETKKKSEEKTEKVAKKVKIKKITEKNTWLPKRIP